MTIISLIVPVYNVDPYLEQCLASLSAQDCREAEFILVDDGSTDSSGAICDRFAAADSRFRVIHKPNGGVSSARNAGLEASRGRLIGFVDGDDWLEPDALSCLVSAAETAPEADAVLFGYYDYCTGGDALPASDFTDGEIVPARQALARVLEEGGYFTSVWNKLFDRRVIFDRKDRLLFDPSYSIGEDEKFLVEALSACRSCLLMRRPLYHYRFRESSALNSAAVTPGRIDSLHLKRSLAAQLGCIDPLLQRAALARLCNRAMPLLAAAYCTGCTGELSQMLELLRGSWKHCFAAADISILRKARVIAVRTLIALHAPSSLVGRAAGIKHRS